MSRKNDVLLLEGLLPKYRRKYVVVYCEGNKAMAKGMVKWFNADKGYGFIEPAGGGKDIFVHISQVQASGLKKLENNQPVEFEMVDGVDARQMAGNIKLTD